MTETEIDKAQSELEGLRDRFPEGSQANRILAGALTSLLAQYRGGSKVPAADAPIPEQNLVDNPNKEGEKIPVLGPVVVKVGEVVRVTEVPARSFASSIAPAASNSVPSSIGGTSADPRPEQRPESSLSSEDGVKASVSNANAAVELGQVTEQVAVASSFEGTPPSTSLDEQRSTSEEAKADSAKGSTEADSTKVELVDGQPKSESLSADEQRIADDVERAEAEKASEPKV